MITKISPRCVHKAAERATLRKAEEAALAHSLLSVQ
jgi:hypothetical protein